MADKSVGTVLSADTIEHVFPVFKAFEEHVSCSSVTTGRSW